MARKADEQIPLDPHGFNEMRMSRTGPIVYNKFDQYVGGSLQKYGEFSIGEQAFFADTIDRGHVVVEVGANIGAHTIHLSRLVGPDGEVHAFEPQRIVFQTLCANLALNQCANVFAHQAAVGADAGTILVPALDPSSATNFGGLSLRVVRAYGERVPLLTLDSLDLPACHFLKVDVEGMEVEVLKGAQRLIDTYRPLMYLENDRDDRSAELLGLVLGMDYAVFWHMPRLFNPENFDGVSEDIFPGIVSVNVFCCPSEAGLEFPGMRRITTATQTWRG